MITLGGGKKDFVDETHYAQTFPSRGINMAQSHAQPARRLLDRPKLVEGCRLEGLFSR